MAEGVGANLILGGAALLAIGWMFFGSGAGLALLTSSNSGLFLFVGIVLFLAFILGGRR